MEEDQAITAWDVKNSQATKFPTNLVMSSYKIYDQGYWKTCTLLSVTRAVRECCKQYGILVSFDAVQQNLKKHYKGSWYYKKQVCESTANENKRDNTLLEIVGTCDKKPGRDFGYHPEGFDRCFIDELENQSKKIEEMCDIWIYVEKVGHLREGNYCYDSDEFILKTTSDGAKSHCMHIICKTEEHDKTYFVCRNTTEIGQRIERLPKVLVNEKGPILYKVSVRVSERYTI